MNELISINEKEFDGKTFQTTTAKELYLALGLNPVNWSRWYVSNIENNPFAIKDEDWWGFFTMKNGNETADAAITVDFAKRLAMAAKTEKGEEVRKYFIECERKVKSSISSIVDPQIAAMMLILQNLDSVKQEQKMHVAALDTHSERLNELEQATKSVLDGHGFYSILGYCNRKGIKIDKTASAAYGRRATSESKMQGVMMGSVPDARYGSVKTYSEDILDIVFGENF